MEDVGMLALDGFDEAIIGTALTPDGGEVLVYNAKLVECMLALMVNGNLKLTIIDYLEMMVSDPEGRPLPLFVYLDDSVKSEVRESREETHLRVVH